MGWGRMFLLGNIGQQMDLDEQQSELERLRVHLATERMLGEKADEMIGRLRRDNDELKLYLAAVVRLLASKGIAAPGEIEALVKTIDQEDGKVDGKMGPATV